MKLALVTSKMRPGGLPDVLIHLVETLLQAGHELSPLVGEPDDPLAGYAKVHGLPWLDLHPLFCEPRRRIIKALEQEGPRADFGRWLDEFQQFNPTVGIAFLTGWIPDSMLSLPEKGFINYHPGRLPEMRGIEPETFAILDGTPTHGTVHVATSEFDEGNILAITEPVDVEDTDCALRLLYKLALSAPGAILKALDRLDRGETGEPQGSWVGHSATLTRLRQEMSIDLSTISASRLKRIVQCCLGHPLGVRINGSFDGQRLIFDPVTVLEGDFPGEPGQLFADFPDHPGSEWNGSKIFRIHGGLMLAKCRAYRDEAPAWKVPSLLEKPFLRPPVFPPLDLLSHYVPCNGAVAV